MTPTPMILFVWGVLLASGILPNNILGFRVPQTAAWRRARRIIGISAIVSGGLWLCIDLTLPLALPSGHPGTRLADAIGWCSLAVAAVTATWLIASRRPASTDALRRVD